MAQQSSPLPLAAKLQPSPRTLPSNSRPATDKFQVLVSNLSQILGPSFGLTSKDINPAHLQKLMQDYVSQQDEWEQYAFADRSRGYTRNLVDEGNGSSNLLVLVWTPGKGSPIHDHADAHCLMKVLQGTLKETRYEAPPNAQRLVVHTARSGSSSPSNSSAATTPTVNTPVVRSEDESVQGDEYKAEEKAMKITKEMIYKRDEVTYMSDDLGLHRISNPGTELAVSLHLYTPPNAAREGCYIFDENSGRSSHITQSNYYSRFGKLL